MNQFKLNSNIQQFKSYTPQLPYISPLFPHKHFRYEMYAELQKELFNKNLYISKYYCRERASRKCFCIHECKVFFIQNVFLCNVFGKLLCFKHFASISKYIHCSYVYFFNAMLLIVPKVHYSLWEVYWCTPSNGELSTFQLLSMISHECCQSIKMCNY